MHRPGRESGRRGFFGLLSQSACGIGSFPQTITDRAIFIAMQRRKDCEKVERFLYRTVEPVGKALNERASAFVTQRRDEIGAAYEAAELEFISDRDAEAWGPLFAILSVAAPERLPELRTCAERLTHSKGANAEDDSLALRLLLDMREVWSDSEPKIFTAELLQRLKKIEDGPWASDERFDGRRLSRLLRPFGITAATVRIGAETRKGYTWQDAGPPLPAIWPHSRHNRHNPHRVANAPFCVASHICNCDGEKSHGSRVGIGL